jgi:hypothetical protein
MRSSVIAYIIFIILVVVTLLVLNPNKTQAHHGVTTCGAGSAGMLACLSKTSPFVERYVKPGAEVTFCFDARSTAYSGFVSQMTGVMQRWGSELKHAVRQVPMPASRADLSCVVRWEMPEVHPCSGCGAHIYTQNLPILIESNWRAGFARFDSTGGHEYGHGACLLDEHYDKAGFRSYILTFGSWIHGAPTVMDAGTPYLPEYAPLGIWYPTEYDLDRCEETLG